MGPQVFRDCFDGARVPLPVQHLHFDTGLLGRLVKQTGTCTSFNHSSHNPAIIARPDILKKYFYPGARRSKPMVTFLLLVAVLLAIQLLNATMFLCRRYSSEGMILVNSITMSLVSIVCVCEITIFSHRFRTVLKTLGDLNQVSTETQVKRIIWITVTGNIFFFTRAFLETTFAIVLIMYWHRTGTVAEVFSHAAWDSYILLKHWSELAILALMLYILQSRFTSAVGNGNGLVGSEDGYQAVPDTDKGDNRDTTLSV